jgi:hypothetical protein
MTKPIVKKGIIQTIHEVDPNTKKRIVKRLREIFTDAVGPNASVPDENALKDAIDDALAQTQGEDIDGLNLRPIQNGEENVERVGVSN